MLRTCNASWPYGSSVSFPSSLIISICLFGVVTKATEYVSLTLQVPVGTSNQGDPHLLCTPAQWTDILLFLLGNFVAHAFTVVSKPGEPFRDLAFRTFVALLFPHFGMKDGLRAIFRHACTVSDQLQRACRAKALCMVVRSQKWRPQVNDIIQGIKFTGRIARL